MAENVPGQKSNISLIPAGLSTEDVKLKPQISLFRTLIESHYGNTLRLNEMTGKPEYWDEHSNQWKEWNDTNDAQMRAYFQENYGLYNPRMLDDALSIHFTAHTVNPVVNKLKSLEWDGKPRVEQFLHDVMKCADTPYIRECSRLIFAGGVHRAMEPGSKYDIMVVLTGEQGCGKSTIVRWLNMDDAFFKEIKTISGKEGIEALRGCWIGEMAELMAMTRMKETEAVKAYVTTQTDSYRPPYAKHVVTVPRRCCFIGTTNNQQFLTDKTGNRRFFPVDCSDSNVYELNKHEAEVKQYIEQAWAEAMQLYRDGNLQPYPKADIVKAIKEAQEAAIEDDYRIGLIEQFLMEYKSEIGDTTCVYDIWLNALGETERKPERKDSNAISQIMRDLGWQLTNRKVQTDYGRQRAFMRVDPFFPPE